MLPPVSRDFQWQAPWKGTPHTVQPQHFREISSESCGIGPRRSLAGEDVEQTRERVVWPRRAALSHGSLLIPWRICQWLSRRSGENGHHPSAAVHRRNVNCDLLVDLTLTNRRLFTETEEDGRNEAIQEQVMGHDLQTILTNCKHTIRRRRLADMTKDPRVRVAIQSHCGKHRSVAMAEFLAKECMAFARVKLWHMEAHRWDKNYVEAPRDDEPAPKHSLVLCPVSNNEV